MDRGAAASSPQSGGLLGPQLGWMLERSLVAGFGWWPVRRGGSHVLHSSSEGQCTSRVEVKAGQQAGGPACPPPPPPQTPEALTAPPLSPACSPGINRSTSPNPASPLLPEACWRGTAQSLKGPQQKGSLGRKQDDWEQSSDTATTPQGRVSSSTSHQTLQRRSSTRRRPQHLWAPSAPDPPAPGLPWTPPPALHTVLCVRTSGPAQAPRRRLPSDRNPPPDAWTRAVWPRTCKRAFMV